MAAPLALVVVPAEFKDVAEVCTFVVVVASVPAPATLVIVSPPTAADVLGLAVPPAAALEDADESGVKSTVVPFGY